MDALGAGSDDVKRALVGLKAAGAVEARGVKRGTNYVASGRGGARKARRR